jgi:hypothetical protein
MPLIPVPSSSGSSIRWPVISDSCHVSERKSKSNSNDSGVAEDGNDAGEDAVAAGDEVEESGRLNGDDRCRGLGDLIPLGGGIRFAGGVLVSAALTESTRLSSFRSDGCDMMYGASSGTGFRVGCAAWGMLLLSDELSVLVMVRCESSRAATVRGEAEPRRGSSIEENERAFTRDGDVLDGSLSLVGVEGKRVSEIDSIGDMEV